MSRSRTDRGHRPLRVVVAVVAAFAIAAGRPAAALGHGDPPGHYLETDLLYPAFGDRPTQSVELALLGLLQASASGGYPIRVALIANDVDVEDPTVLDHPQVYAEAIVAAIESERGKVVGAPLVVVSPAGLGVAGRAMIDGVVAPIEPATAAFFLAGLAAPTDGHGDALAASATRAVRQIADLGGHPLPAVVAPASAELVATARSADGIDWVPFVVFGLLFVPAWLAYEVWTRQRGCVAANRPPAAAPPGDG